MAKNKNNNLDFLSKCPFCGNAPQRVNLTVIEERDQRTTFHASCSRCRTSSIVVISSLQAGIVSIGIATDLDKNEVKNKFSEKALSADEVIDAHEYIFGCKGNFIEIIKNIKN